MVEEKTVASYTQLEVYEAIKFNQNEVIIQQKLKRKIIETIKDQLQKGKTEMRNEFNTLSAVFFFVFQARERRESISISRFSGLSKKISKQKAIHKTYSYFLFSLPV